jgi:1,4-alpha-glucan branching enzyme
MHAILHAVYQKVTSGRQLANLDSERDIRSRPMSKAKREKGRNGVEFSCHAPEAKSVHLAGTFNDWNPEATAMEEAGDGVWKSRLNLEPGRYEYKFVVDGRWCCDPSRDDHDLSVPDCVPNSFGTLNRVIDVE